MCHLFLRELFSRYLSHNTRSAVRADQQVLQQLETNVGSLLRRVPSVRAQVRDQKKVQLPLLLFWCAARETLSVVWYRGPRQHPELFEAGVK